MAKIQIKSERITPCGGFFPIMDSFDRVLSGVVDSTLGLRSKLIGYQYSAIIRSLMCVYFCGGSCIEDVTTHLMSHLSLHPTLRTCSAYCLKSHGGVRGFYASLWRFLLRCTLFCHSVATFLTSVSSYEGGCGFEDKKLHILKTHTCFNHQLEQAGLEVTIRVSHGREINAACGQLANTYNKFKKND